MFQSRLKWASSPGLFAESTPPRLATYACNQFSLISEKGLNNFIILSVRLLLTSIYKTAR